MEYKFQAIILSKTEIAETDRIYSLYTREAGKVRLLAKGVRKPNAKLAGNLEPITYAEIFVVKNRGMGKITGAQAVESFLPLKESIFALEKVFYILRILNRLISEEEKDEKVFNLLFNYLQILNKLSVAKEEDLKIEVLTFGMVFKLMHSLGYGLQMKNCAHCQGKLKSGENYFSAERGGVLCLKCVAIEGKMVKISDESIKMIRIFLENKLQNLVKIKIEKKNLANLKIIANEAIRWVMG